MISGCPLFLRQLKEADVDYLQAFGLEITKVEQWNGGKGKVSTKRVKAAGPSRGLYEDLAIKCYHGGRNESFTFGPTLEGDWYDWIPERRAYTTGLCDLLVPDYARAHTS